LLLARSVLWWPRLVAASISSASNAPLLGRQQAGAGQHQVLALQLLVPFDRQHQPVA
jgi:hypothetical protein